MKFFLTLFAIVAAANAGAVRGHHNHISKNVTELISEYGYPVQNFTVQTEDGYLLDIIRIPGGVDYKNQFENKQRQEDNDDVTTGKPAVILMHGLLSSAEDFVIGGPTQGLAFVLAERGYDVFIANSRGNIYARKHTTLNPEKDAAFWRFCWHDIGKKDLPTIIDEVLKITEQRKVYYIGHMQGTTAFYVMASEKPEYNDKIQAMISLGPIAFMKDTTNQMLRLISENQDSKAWIMKNLGVNEFHPSNEFMLSAGEQDCISRGVIERVCQNPFFLVNGYESENMNMTTIKMYAPRLPAGAATRQILHYAQLMKTGRFEKFSDTLSSQVEEYDLSKISVPVYIFYVPTDKISSERDVQMLISKLPNVVENIKMTQYTNNVDLILGNNVFKTVVDVLKRV